MDFDNEQKRSERAANILDTARRMITERGVENVNMRDLASESGVSVPTIYKLLGDKEQVLSQAMQKQLADMLQEIVKNSSRPGVERFLALLEFSGRQALELGNYSREVVGHLLSNNMKDRISEQLAELVNHYIAAALEEMKQSGQLEPWADPRTLAEHVTIHVIMCCFGWHSGYVSDRSLPACFVYGPVAIVLGPSKGAARKLLEKKLQEVQPLAVAAPRDRKS